MYTRHNIKHRTAKKHTRLAPERHEQLKEERRLFAQNYIAKFMGSNRRNYLFIDETTFVLWPALGKTWQYQHDKVSVPYNYKRLSSFTLFYAIGPALVKPVYLLSQLGTTNQEVKNFLIKVAKMRINQYQRPYLILDNAKAHTSNEVKELMQHHFQPMYQPPYSSCFNIVESVFSILKA